MSRLAGGKIFMQDDCGFTRNAVVRAARFLAAPV